MNFFKKTSPKVIAFLIIVYLSFTLIGCPPKPTEEIIEKTIEEVTTTEEVEETIIESAEEEIREETTEEEITETTEEVEREPKDNIKVEELIKTEMVLILEKEFEIEVTKIKFQNDKLDLAYDTGFYVDETIQKEMFNIVKAVSIAFSHVENNGFAISATSEMADTIKSETSQEIQDRFLNLEISFEEWVQECIIK